MVELKTPNPEKIVVTIDAETEHTDDRRAARQPGEEPGTVDAGNVPDLRHGVLPGLRESQMIPMPVR